MIVRRLPESELYHHGIKGQEWGDQNGPPYPLDRQTSAAIKRSAKKKSFLERAKDKRKMRQLRNAKVKKKKEQAEKEKAINSGDVNEIDKIKHKLTDEELTRAISRINMNMSIEDAKSNASRIRYDKIARSVDTITKVAGTIGNVAQSAGNVYETLKKVGVISKDEPSPLQKAQEAAALSKANYEIASYKANKEALESTKAAAAAERAATTAENRYAAAYYQKALKGLNSKKSPTVTVSKPPKWFKEKEKEKN